MRPTGRTYEFPNGDKYPIVEASAGTFIPVSAEDIAEANPRDPYGCAIACALMRTWGAPHATISRTVAYVVTLWKGQLVAMKYTVPPNTRRAIKLFDETEEMPPGGFQLNALERDKTSAAKKRHNDKRKDPNYKPAYSRPRTSERDNPITFRNLTGRVHTERSVA